MKATPVSIDLITIDHDIQSRAATNRETVVEYAEAWKNEAEFPPVELFCDGVDYYVGDGIHRILSAQSAGRSSVTANVHKGGKHEASIFACGANKSHGLKRTNADKRKCVERVLTLEPEWADNRIAAHIGVGDDMVKAARKQLSENESCKVNVNPPTRVGSDGKRRAAPKPAAKKTPKPEPVAAPPAPEKPVKNGKPTISTADRKDAHKFLGSLIRTLDRMGLYAELKAPLNVIAERIA